MSQVETREGTLGVTAVLDEDRPHVLITSARADGTCMMSRLSPEDAQVFGTSVREAAAAVQPIADYKNKMDDAARVDVERRGLI